MNSKRLVILLGVLLSGFGAVFLLPASRFNEPVGIKLVLPEYLGKWHGVDEQVSEREKATLASDTEFARKIYSDGFGNQILVSIVLSGHDLDNSIHRPERCLPAQGWTIADSRKVEIPLPDTMLQVTRLHDVRELRTREGKLVPLYSLNYYWFVGYHHLTASHLSRTFIDIKDRVLNGYNQRWAFVTVASNITEGFIPFGQSEAQTDIMMQDFIQQLSPRLILSPAERSFAEKSERPAVLSRG